MRPPLDAGPAVGAGDRRSGFSAARVPGRPSPAADHLRHPPPPRRRSLSAGSAAPVRHCRSAARPRGPRPPTLAKVLADKGTPWRRVTVPGWYGEGGRHRWRSARTPPSGASAGYAGWCRSAGWLLRRTPAGGFGPGGSADPAQEPLLIIGWLRPALAAGGAHVPRGARPPGRVETQRQWSDEGDRPHHTLLARPVVGRHSAGGSPRQPNPAPGCGRA